MKNLIPHKHPFDKWWTNPELTGLNNLRPRAYSFPFPSSKEALIMNLENNKWINQLKGSWKFKLFSSPEEVKYEMLISEYPDKNWSKIKVPGNWTMQGFDKPHYTNKEMPFTNIPPKVPDRNPTGVYRTNFELSKEWENRRVIIHIGGEYQIRTGDLYSANVAL